MSTGGENPLFYMARLRRFCMTRVTRPFSSQFVQSFAKNAGLGATSDARSRSPSAERREIFGKVIAQHPVQDSRGAGG